MPIHPLASIVLLALAATTPAWAQSSGAAGPARGCPPLETREPNVPEQRPAFEGQTRACPTPSNVAFDLVVLAQGRSRCTTGTP